jgi:hypothetical protein
MLCPTCGNLLSRLGSWRISSDATYCSEFCSDAAIYVDLSGSPIPPTLETANFFVIAGATQFTLMM